jgi:2'-hydroxyisoflavone reductase
MKILVLGGTVFLGRHFVEAALKQGHVLTLFNRGNNPGLFPELETLIGDRDGNLDSLNGRHWDAVLDTSGNIPRLVKASAEMLAGSTGHYTFISSISVYDLDKSSDIDETSAVIKLEDENVEEITGETYGGLKALCELAAEKALPGRVLNVRPGLIVGPNDPSDRFTYWPWRISKGGKVLAPGNPSAPMQIIDVRDLAEWLVQVIEENVTGTLNATGPQEPYTVEAILRTCQETINPAAEFEWVDDEFLLAKEVGVWVEMPLWVPEGEGTALMQVSVDRALAARLKFRRLDATIRDTFAWAQTRSQDYEWRAGLAPEREKELLERWHRQNTL